MSSLRRATEEEVEARDRLAHSVWGRRLSPTQFLERERTLRALPWAKEAMSSWVLTGEAGELLASLEAFRMPSQGRNGIDGNAYAIGSLFIEPALRGQGHAPRLVEALIAHLCAEDPTAQAVVLFSDSGSANYARHGFEARPAITLSTGPREGDPAAAVDRLIRREELGAEYAALAAPADDFVIWPSPEQLDWHIERGQISSRLLSRPQPTSCGAVAGRSRAVWAAEVQSDRLYILAIDARSTAEFEALLLAARREALQIGLNEVVLWDQPWPFSWYAGLAGATRHRRTRTLPMIRPLQPEVRPEAWRTIPRGIWV